MQCHIIINRQFHISSLVHCVSTDSIESEKVSDFAVSDRIFLFQRVFSPKTFSLSRLYNGCYGYGNKRLTEKNRQKTNNNLNRPRCTIQMSIKIKGCHLYKTNGNGGKRQTALPPEKIILPCGTVSIALPLCFTFISPTSTLSCS